MSSPIPLSIICTLVIAICFSSAQAEVPPQTSEFTINEQTLHIPAPENFVRVTPENMPTLYRISQQLSDPMNDTLAYYVPADTADNQTDGEIKKSFILKINKSLRNVKFSRADFERFKLEMAANNRKIFQEIQQKVAPHLQATSDNLTREFDMDISMQVADIMPMSPHLDTENSFGFSTRMNLGMSLDGDQENQPMVVTSIFINPAGVLLFLYCYADPQDLEWSRAASEQWSREILAANPPAPEQPSGRRIDWGQVMRKGLVGAIIGGILGLLISFASKRRQNK